jgi:hypothetical protein
MSTFHDIYDPPPVPPMDSAPARRGPLVFSAGDFFCLVGLCLGLFLAAIVAWHTEPALAIVTALAGTLVILESWLTALGFLHRCRPLGLKARWTIFLAAIAPWLIGLGSAAALMLGLFWAFDRFWWC